jgi:integrase
VWGKTCAACSGTLVAEKGEKAKCEDCGGEQSLPCVGLHDCRHTYASLMIAAGMRNMKALSTFMGHGTVSVTWDRYGHLLPGSEAEAASKLDSYLERAVAT